MRLKITLFGEVHDDDFIISLVDEAGFFAIDRFDTRKVVINDEKALIVLVEGEKEQLEEFVKAIKTSERIRKLKVEEYDRPVRTMESFCQCLMIELLAKLANLCSER